MVEGAFKIPARCSPLQDMEEAFRDASREAGESIQLREIPFQANLNLRGDVGNPAFCKAVQTAVGFDLPGKANTAAASGAVSALWLGPNEWMLVGDPDAEADLAARLTQQLQGIHSSVTDVSDYRTVIELSGTRCREILAKGCSLDVRPRSFRPGQCAQTVFAHVSVLLHLIDAAPVWRLHIRNSLANYLATWLLDAAAEFRVAKRDLNLARPSLFGSATVDD
jgi:sarcosine oxidase, subunit gamma